LATYHISFLMCGCYNAHINPPFDALIDSLVYGGINAIEPPYLIRVSGAQTLPREVKDELILAILALAESQGTDTGVRFEGNL
jgi:hypothetical protein